MIKVGITGGIGSGKSTFCRTWEELGAFVLYADDFAKQLMQKDSSLKNKIKEVFGNKSYDQDGKLNRQFLANEAFKKGRVEELNNLVHPVLWERTEELADQKEEEGCQVFAKEAAILLNNGRPEDLDYVVLVLADEEKRIKRTAERDGSSKEEIAERIKKQPNFEKLVHLADFVIVNDGTLSDLKQKSRDVYQSIIETI